MRTVFADAVYWIAITKPNDPWQQAALEAKRRLGPTRIVTTDEVLTEFLAALSRSGENLRKTAVRMVREILSNPNVKVVPQSRASFLEGLSLYEARGDKQYSLTDCISMNTLQSESIREC